MDFLIAARIQMGFVFPCHETISLSFVGKEFAHMKSVFCMSFALDTHHVCIASVPISRIGIPMFVHFTLPPNYGKGRREKT